MITSILLGQDYSPRRAAEARRTLSRPFAVPFKSKNFLMGAASNTAAFD